MFAYVARRIMTTIPLLLVGTFIVYALTASVANPLAKLATCTTCDQAAFDRIIDLYNLDDPIPVRYGKWMLGAATGDMGQAPSQGNFDVFPLVMERMANTAQLAIPAFLIIAVLAIALGVFSAVNQYSKSDYFVTGFSFVGISMPTFFFALVLQVIFGVWWQDWFDAKPFYVSQMHMGSIVDIIRSHTLPILTLVLVITAAESRFERASMLEVINSDYIRTARAKGLPRWRVILKHGLRNAMIPLVTIWAIDFAALLGGSVVTETIFSWPGLGPLLLDGIFQGDLNLTMGIVMLIAMLVIFFNLIADLVYGMLDPRIRYE
ncbi:MAG: ABC transporter permease [Actinobacteria bacterium]|nr:ABC transporter permease [Actinomycetota bacterium]